MKAHVSTMLTESGLSIALPVRHFKESVRRNGGCKPTSARIGGLFGLTMRGTGYRSQTVQDESDTEGACDAPAPTL